MKNYVVNINKHNYEVLIMRPTKWGNPFVIGVDGTREQVIQKYREWVVTKPELMDALVELHGKILGCCCKPDRCHGDILHELTVAKFGKPIELKNTVFSKLSLKQVERNNNEKKIITQAKV